MLAQRSSAGISQLARAVLSTIMASDMDRRATAQWSFPGVAANCKTRPQHRVHGSCAEHDGSIPKRTRLHTPSNGGGTMKRHVMYWLAASVCALLLSGTPVRAQTEAPGHGIGLFAVNFCKPFIATCPAGVPPLGICVSIVST